MAPAVFMAPRGLAGRYPDVEEATKTCRKCAQAKPLAAFNRKLASKDGLQPACRSCVSAYNRQLYLRDPAKVRAKNDAWAAVNRGRVRVSERARHARVWREHPEEMRAYYRSYHARTRQRRREIMREAARRRRAAAPDLEREYQRLWREANRDRVSVTNRRRRARLVGAVIVRFTADQLVSRLSMFPGCWMCGGPKETVDHVKPLSKGGAHALANLRPACRPCNASKREAWPLPHLLVRRRLRT